MGCAQALDYLEDMPLHAARGGEHVTIELSCRTCPYTPRGVAGNQGSHGKEHETEKENNNKITNEIDIEKGNILIALRNMPLDKARMAIAGVPPEMPQTCLRLPRPRL